MRRFALALAGVLLATLCAAPTHATLDLEGLLAPAFPSELRASTDGGTLAWLEVRDGARSVWVATAPAWTARRLADYPQDDGLALSQLALSPDGMWLAFVRGGDEGGAPETNPTSNPAGAEATIWLARSDGRAPARSIGAGGEPTFSPRGDRLLFVRGGQLWSAPLVAKKGKSEPTQLTHLRGHQWGARFSPDGGRVAFTSARDTHAFVGVLDLAAQRVTWMDPGVDRDALPTWSPDGTALVFLRRPARDAPLAFVPRQTGEPWSLRVADPATGKGREIFRSDEGDGSVFHFFETQETNLWWSRDGRVVFPWEKSGWHHLWSLPATGGEAVDLTPGEREVEHATLSPDGTTVVFTSNLGDLDGRTLEAVPTGGGAAIRLDPDDDELEFEPAALADGTCAWLRAGAREPLTVVLAERGKATRALRPGAIPAIFPTAELQVPRKVVFPSTDGLTIHGQLFLPPVGTAPGSAPALIFVHGGPVRQMFAGFHLMDYYSQSYAMNQLLASRGYVVLSVNYRSGIGYGLAFREADKIAEEGASEFQDVLGGALYLKSLPEVDGGRIGIWGGSYGGYLTALALARASNLFKAGVDFHGVHDWNLEFDNPPFTRTYLETAARLDRAFRASPMADLDTWRSPVLLIHGDDDHNVPFVETVRLAEALRARKVPFETLIFPDEIHGFLRHETWMRAYTAMLDFFDRKLARQD